MRNNSRIKGKSGKKQNFRKGFETEDKDLNSKKGGKASDWICSEGKPTNDPAWYVNNPYLSRDVGSIWFSRPTGSPLARTAIFPNATTMNDIHDAGIMAIPSVITWGGTGNLNTTHSASINLTAQKLYQYVVHANSRNVSYDKKDLMLSMMAIDAIYTVITEAIRAYRLIAQYDPQNRFVNNLLTVSNWDPDDLRHNVAEFRYTINWAITRVNKFFMPSLFDMTKAHTSAYENVYCDRPDLKGQYIIKFSLGIWLYNDVEGCLEYVRYFKDPETGNMVSWASTHTVSIFKTVINAMISALENSQYMGIMQGDLLKAFGMENMSNYAYIGIDMPIVPVFDQEFSYKLHNADIGSDIGDFFRFKGSEGYTGSSGMIYRDTNNVNGDLYHLAGCTRGNINPNTDIDSEAMWVDWRMLNGSMIDLPAGVEPSPENVLLMSLYKGLQTTRKSENWLLSDTTPVDCFTGDYMPEILLKGNIYYDPDDVSQYQTFNSDRYNTTALALLSRFAHTPLVTQRGSGTVSPFIYWETNNVALIDAKLLARMNEVILWSLWSNSTIATADIRSRDTRV